MSAIRTGRLALATLVLSLGCKSLDIENPNAPDASRAPLDPVTVESVSEGLLIQFFNVYNGLNAGGPLITQAQSHSASWNNFNMNFYSSIDNDGTRNSRPWQNNPASAARIAMEWYWEGYYSIASSARDVLTAIRINGLELSSEEATRRAEVVAELALGASLGQIALFYDKGYFIDENSDLTSLQYIDRKALRDSAYVTLRDAAALATANTFALPGEFTGGSAGYTNLTLAELANSLNAATLAYWPRDAAEVAAVGTSYWSTVASLANNGLNQDFVFIGDGCSSVCPELQSYTNDILFIRVHTRIANMLDPVTQATPYPVGGNPQPNSADRRLGDGSFGIPEMVEDYGTIPRTVNAGTDFAYTDLPIMFPSRGTYHESNLGHIRWDASGTQDVNSIYFGYGPVPLMMRGQNDLIHAEALLRSGGSTATAAGLINGTRVTRGGLTPAGGAESVNDLLTKMEYENEIELLSQGPMPYLVRRRQSPGLITGTPHEMPVPAKELGVKGEALYTFGGTGLANSATPANAGVLPP